LLRLFDCGIVVLAFAGVGGTYDATVCTIFSSSASAASGERD
jgi:hypothetical protein